MINAIPIALRELRRANKERWLIFARVGSATLAALGLLAIGSLAFGPYSGRSLFFPLIIVAWGLGIAGAGAWAAPCLHEEKSTRMLDLLLLTKAGGSGIVLAKAVGRGAPIMQIVLAAIPVMASVLVLGGVSTAEFWRAMAFLIITLLTNLAIGLLMAVWFRSVWAAALATSLAIATVYSVGGVADWALLRALELEQTVASILPHPAAGLEQISDMVPGERLSTFSDACAVIGAIGLGATLLACFGLRRSVRQKPQRSDPIPRIPWRLFPKVWKKARPFGFRGRPLSRWVFSRRWRWWQTMAVCGSIAVIGFGAWTLTGEPTPIRLSMAFVGASIAQHIAFRILTTSRVVGAMNAARRDGEFELIAVTPIREARLSEQLIRGFRAEFYFGLATLALVDLGLLAVAESSLHADRYLFPVWALIFGDWVMVAMETEGALPRCISLGAMGQPIKSALRHAIASNLLWPWAIFAISLPIVAPLAVLAVGSVVMAFATPGALTNWDFEGPGLALMGAIVWRWLIGAVYAASNYYTALPKVRNHLRGLLSEGPTGAPRIPSLFDAAAQNATLRYR